MALQIWLLNPYQVRYPCEELCAQVKKLMEPVVKKRDAGSKNKFGTVLVNSRYTMPPVGPRDLAVYVVPVRDCGFVGVAFGSGGREHAGGLTTHDEGKACSEVYLGEEISGSGGVLITAERVKNDNNGYRVEMRFEPQLVAKAVFHELMHNVTPLWHVEKLHHISGVSLGKEEIASNFPQSNKDVEILAGNMDKSKHTQWTGAWAWLISEGNFTPQPA